MPLFKPILAGQSKSGQMQYVICPRCREEIEGDEVFVSGEGIGMRRVEGDYSCSCGYSVKVIEVYPFINRSQET